MGDKRARDARLYAFHRLRDSFHRCAYSFHRCGGPPSRREVWGRATRHLEPSYTTPGAGSQPCSFQRGLWGSRGFRGRNRNLPLIPRFAEGALPLFTACGRFSPRKREVLGLENRRLAECRRARDARPPNMAENCNCEMRFATLGCIIATVGCILQPSRLHRRPRRGAHCAPVYPRCYNNPSSGRAKGDRATAKPISNRRKAVGLDRRICDLLFSRWTTTAVEE